MSHPNQHTVPRFYLGQFAPERREENPRIYSFDKMTRRAHYPSIRTAAAELHFSELGDTGIESWLQYFEDRVAGPLRRLLEVDRVADLKEEEIAAIGVFLAIQFVRTREHREGIKAVGSCFESIFSSTRVWTHRSSPTTQKSLARAVQVGGLERTALELSEIMLEMRWVLTTNKTAVPFGRRIIRWLSTIQNLPA